MTVPPVESGASPASSVSDPDLVLPPPTPVGRDSTAGVAVRAHLRKQTIALLAADAGLDTNAPDAVHGARVAARRLRSGLRIYGDLLRDDVSARLRPELAWYAGLLSPARDLEVFAAALTHQSDDPHGYADALIPWLRRRHDRALVAARDELRTPRANTLRHALADVARAPSFTDRAAKRAHKVLAPRVLHTDKRATSIFHKLGADSDSTAWHSSRISAKRARYAAEVGAPVLGRACVDLAAIWAAMTEPLGDAQDAVIQRALVLDRVDDSSMPLSAGEAFVCGVFVASTHDREVECHQRAAVVWQETRTHHARIRRALGR